MVFQAWVLVFQVLQDGGWAESIITSAQDAVDPAAWVTFAAARATVRKSRAFFDERFGGDWHGSYNSVLGVSRWACTPRGLQMSISRGLQVSIFIHSSIETGHRSSDCFSNCKGRRKIGTYPPRRKGPAQGQLHTSTPIHFRVTYTIRKVACPCVCARCGAFAGCSAMKHLFPYRYRAKREHVKTFQALLPECPGPHVAWAVLYVPYLLDSSQAHRLLDHSSVGWE